MTALTCTTPGCNGDFIGGDQSGKTRWCKSHAPGYRPNKDVYYMDIATAVAARGTCPRAKVGAIIIKGDVMVASGYNGAPRGARHCDHTDGGDMDNGHCSRAVHGETNAIANAARHGAVVMGGTLYCTATPCYRCAPLVIQAGIARVVIGASYRPDERAFRLLTECGVIVEQLLMPTGTTVRLDASGKQII